MSISIEPLACGTLTASRASFEQGGSDEPVTLPVPSWLIRHPEGTVLFDTGMPEALTAEGPLLDLVSLFFAVGLDPEELVSARLERAEFDPAEIDLVVLSHLHFDHVGGLHLLPNARIIVQRDEWVAGMDDELAASNSLQSELFDLGHDRLEVDGEHDVFGDGLVTCLPTPGHTPGHQSLRVRLADREVVLCGDCAYFEATLNGGPLPGGAHDHDQQAASIGRLQSMRDDGAWVIPGHDADVFAALPNRLE